MLIIVIRTLILYLMVIISLRVMGKRQIGELQPSELVVAIMISDLASVPMQAIDIPLLNGILPVLTLIVAEVFMSFASLKSKSFRKLLSGEPSVVIYKGAVNEKELSRLRFNISDLMEELRLNGCGNIADVEAAVLETNGKLSVVQKKDKSGLPFIVASDGSYNTGEIKRAELTAEKVDQIIKSLGVASVRDVFIASIDSDGNAFVQPKRSFAERGKKDKEEREKK